MSANVHEACERLARSGAENGEIMLSRFFFFIRPWLPMLFSSAGTVLRNAAVVAVEQVQNRYADASGADKREMAYAVITECLEAHGIAASDQLIWAAIEIAVSRQRAA